MHLSTVTCDEQIKSTQSGETSLISHSQSRSKFRLSNFTPQRGEFRCHALYHQCGESDGMEGTEWDGWERGCEEGGGQGGGGQWRMRKRGKKRKQGREG